VEIFNEKDLVSLKLSAFKKDDGSVLTPGEMTALWYRIDETFSATQQVGQTNVTPADPAYVKFLPAQNLMVDAAKEKEIVSITVHFEWGPSTGKTKMYAFQRNNLRFYP